MSGAGEGQLVLGDSWSSNYALTHDVIVDTNTRMAAEGVMDGLSACECPVCFNLLGSDRPPMSMPCGHTLCHTCVEDLAGPARKEQRARTFRCPLCREWVNRESVMLNVTLRDLIGKWHCLWGACISSAHMHFPSP